MNSKEWARQLFRSCGVEVGAYRYTVAARRQQMLAHFQIRTLVDVGANVGQYATAARRAGYQHDIISVEPTSATFAELAARSANDPLWRVCKVALGASEGHLTMNLSEGSIFNSALEVADYAVGASPNARVVGTEIVPLCTLDSLLESQGATTASLAVKIDVQGFERDVLEGAEEALRRARIVELELSPTPVYEGQMLLEETVHRMSSSGYVLSLAENLFPEPGTGRALQFNGIFVRL
jgi:FkbM family methyltransferase